MAYTNQIGQHRTASRQRGRKSRSRRRRSRSRRRGTDKRTTESGTHVGSSSILDNRRQRSQRRAETYKFKGDTQRHNENNSYSRRRLPRRGRSIRRGRDNGRQTPKRSRERLQRTKSTDSKDKKSNDARGDNQRQQTGTDQAQRVRESIGKQRDRQTTQG